MTDREINEAVARKIGWKSRSDRMIESGKFIECSCGQGESIPGCEEPLDYCHSIEAAWGIVPRLPYFQLVTRGYLNMTDGAGITKWECTTVDASDLSNPVVYNAEADAAPMAICLAFLKLP